MKERRYPELVGARSLGGAGRGGLWPLVLGDQVLLELPGQGQGAFRVASDAETRRAGLATSLGFPVFLHSSTLRGNVPGARGADGHCPPSHDVERDFRHAGLDT